MSVNSEINKKDDIRKYINKIVEELINTDEVYECHIREEKLDGKYDNLKIEFKKGDK